jgi:sulfur carrier protein
LGETIEITFNGETRSVSSTTVTELLAEFLFQKDHVAVELNRRIVPRAQYSNTFLCAGDSVEVVQFAHRR